MKQHKRLNLNLSMVVLLLCIATPAAAQMELSLQESLEIALRDNPDIRIAENEIEKSNHGMTRARAERLPSLSLTGYYDRAWELPEIVFSPPPGFPGANGEIRTEMGVGHTINSGFSFEQPLYTGGALSAGTRMASHGITVSEHHFSSVEQRTISNVYDAFHGVLLAREMISVMEESYKSAEENLRQVTRKYEEGSASRFELLRARVEAGTRKPEVTEARNNYEMALDHLKNLLGMEPSQEIHPVGSFSKREHLLLEKEMEALIEQAYRNRPEYHMLQTREKISEEGVRLARSNFLPNIFFRSSMNWRAMRDDISALTGDDFTRVTNSELVVQIPLFQGMSRSAEYQEARVELRQNRIEQNQARQHIATEIRGLYKQLQQAAEILETQEDIMEQAEEGLRLATLLYEEEAATMLEVIDAQLAYNRASTSFYQAIYNYNTRSVQLERALGILTAERL